MAEYIRNFGLANVKSLTLTAGVATSRLELPDNDAEDLMLINLGTTTIFVRTGDASVEADLDAMPIVGGEKGVYSKGLTLRKTSHISAIVGVGTEDLLIIQGQGA